MARSVSNLPNMPSISDHELEELITDLESDRVERKQSFSSDSVKEKVREAVCAFANDLPDKRHAGILVVGVTDEGVASGVNVDDQLLLSLAHIKSDGRIVPPPSLVVEKRVFQGRDIAVMLVEPSDSPPVRLDGRVWIRVGPRRGIATPQEERKLSEKRRHRDRSFDARPIEGSSLEDLNQKAFEEIYLTRAVAPDILKANGRSYAERLTSTGMAVSVDEPTPTVTGLLTLGVSPRDWIPGAYIQFVRYRGIEITDPISDNSQIDGDLDSLLMRVDDKLRASISVSLDFTSGLSRELRQLDYPLVALQQIIRNAVMHRVYEHTNTPIRLYWFDDRVEIVSPGGPFGLVNTHNFGTPGFTDYRNPNIAAAMKILGYVQSFGIGISTARKALRDNGNPELDFTIDDSFIIATIRKV